EDVADRADAQPTPGHAQAGPMRGRLADAEPARVLEDLADRQLGQDSHGQHHPADDLVGQGATSWIGSARGRQSLANGLGRDELFESRQPIQNPARLIGRQGALSVWHASHGLLVAWVLRNPKVTGGCDLRLFRRYCPLGSVFRPVPRRSTAHAAGAKAPSNTACKGRGRFPTDGGTSGDVGSLLGRTHYRSRRCHESHRNGQEPTASCVRAFRGVKGDTLTGSSRSGGFPESGDELAVLWSRSNDVE